ncbi:hypothetical protein [Streptomyces fungicidicus]
MADEQYRWLNRGTAERLLSGEPPEPVDPAARDQARQLAATLRALSPPPPSADDGLPGEAAALAAFRKLREERQGRTEAAPDSGRLSGTRSSDVGLIHIGAARGDRSGTADGPRRLRPLRLGLAAALVAGMVGGAAALAATGALTGPSGGPGSDPAASATATGTHPEQPLLSPSSSTAGAPGGATPGGEHPESVAGTAGGEVDATGGGEEDAGTPGAPGKPGSDSGDGATRTTGRSGKQIAAACRAWRDGKHLNSTREHLLEKAAGGSSHVGTYCHDVLTASAASGGDQENQGNGNGNGNGKANGQNKGQGQSPGNGSGNDDDGDEQGNNGNSGGNGNGNGGGNSQ